MAALTFARSLPIGTASVTPIGWGSVDSNINGVGSTVGNNGVNVLPRGVTATINGNGISMVASAGAPRTGRGSGGKLYYYPEDNVKVAALLSFKVLTAEAFPDTLKWTLVGEEWLSASSSAITNSTTLAGEVADGVGVALSATNPTMSSAGGAIAPSHAASPGPTDSKSKGPIKHKRSVPLSNLFWGSDGTMKSCVAKIPTNIFGGLGRVLDPNGGPGRLLAPIFGTGSGGYAFYASGAKSSSSSAMLSIAVPPGRSGISVVLYNATGNKVDEWTCDATGGRADLPLDDYASGSYTLAFSAAGTLVKKVTLNLSPSVSQSVNPNWMYGDLDGDNVVTQSEISYIAAHVGTTISTSLVADDKTPWFAPPYILASADLNGDGQITQADVNLAQANLGVQGD